MKLRILPQAEAEIKVAAQWYEDRLHGLSELFLAAVGDAIQAIQRHPKRYPRPVGVRTKRNVHRLLLSEFPYSVVYEITEDELIVAAVAHAKQRPGYWRKRFN
jgi:plasmid stabilization system protein ParE